MTAGRTSWWSKDAAYYDRERVVELGEEFGPAGPIVLDWLCCQAKAQNEGGWLVSGFRTLSRGAFLDDADQAERIVRHAVSIGALDDFEVLEDGRRFRCRVSGWRHDQDAAQAGERQRRKRERDAAESTVTDRDEPLLVTEGHGSHASVTPTRQDRTEVTTRGEDSGKAERPKHGGKPVNDITARRLHRALVAFDAAAGTHYAESAVTAAGKWSANASRVLSALTAYPELDEARCAAVIRAGLDRDAYWAPGKPEPRHVFGDGVIGGLIEATSNVSPLDRAKTAESVNARAQERLA